MTIYVVGHKNPDTDSVCSAIIYSEILKVWNQNAIPAVLGEINSETRFVLNKFNFPVPTLLSSINEKDKIAVVDHSEIDQGPDFLTQNNIHSIVDHHKLGNLQSDEPIYIFCAPLGSCASILYNIAKYHDITLPNNIYGLILASILSDTVILKSITTTKTDIRIVEKLSLKLNLDYLSLGKEQFKAKADFGSKSVEEILNIDRKDYETLKGVVAISQVELSDLSLVLNNKNDYMQCMRELMDKNNLFGFIFLVTDILNEGSEVLIISDKADEFEAAFNIKLNNGSTYMKGVMSRKKQIVPILQKSFSK